MATDLETGTDPSEPALARPSLKIVGLHIRNLKSIGSLDLPEDGLGWDGPMPDFLMVGGINGSGKTTLLEFLASAFTRLTSLGAERNYYELPPTLLASEARIDFQFAHPSFGDHILHFFLGSEKFIQENMIGNSLGFQYIGRDSTYQSKFFFSQSEQIGHFISYIVKLPPNVTRNIYPGVVYFPSDRKTLMNLPANLDFVGNLPDRLDFVDRLGPMEHSDTSLAARLYKVRWEDLNAKAKGRDNESTGFDAYSQVFHRFFEGRKWIEWTSKGRLIVGTKGGDVHDLSELSSGEKQVILFMGELLHRWRPGSLILIDEPELHLHESYQTKLWEALLGWQKERGGQVIVATQSDHLFGLSGLGTRVILSSRRSR